MGRGINRGTDGVFLHGLYIQAAPHKQTAIHQDKVIILMVHHFHETT